MQTVLLVILSGIIALLLALFQYAYKTKYSKIKWSLTILRFISIFSLLLLLINPKFEAVSYYEEKPHLVIAVDNSESISFLKQGDKAKNLLEKFRSDKALKERFNIETFTFGDVIKSIDTLSFSEKQSHISGFFKNYNELYKNTTAPVLLITDGNHWQRLPIQ